VTDYKEENEGVSFNDIMKIIGEITLPFVSIVVLHLLHSFRV
jgi:hypothetical protein